MVVGLRRVAALAERRHEADCGNRPHRFVVDFDAPGGNCRVVQAGVQSDVGLEQSVRERCNMEAD